MTEEQGKLLGEALANTFALREVVMMMAGNFISPDYLKRLADDAERAAAAIDPNLNLGMDRSVKLRIASLYRDAIPLSEEAGTVHKLEAWSPDAGEKN